MRKIKNKAAFSLIELLLAFAIIVIVFAAVVPQFRAIRNSWAGAEASATIIQNGRVLAEHLSRNLSSAKYINNVSADGEPEGYITFVDNSDAKKHYALSGGYVVFDSGDGKEAQLAGPVKKFQISCCDVNAVSTKDINDIRLVRLETIFPNDNALGNDKTFSSEVFIRTNDQAAAVVRGDTFELSSGPGFEFDAADGTFPALAQIDSTRYLCTYIGNSNKGYAVVLTVNPGTGAITKGTTFAYDTTNGRFPALAQIDSTRYLCVYGSTGYAVVLTVSGTDVKVGTRCSLETPAARCLYPALVKIDASRYLCAYGGSSSSTAAYAIVLTVSGTDVKAGTRYQYDTFASVPVLTQIDSSRYLCAYQGSSSNIGCAIVLTVSDTTVTWGTKYQYDTIGIHPALWQIDSTRYLCAYAGSGGGYAAVMTVSGTKIASGARYQFDKSCSYPVLSQIDSTRYLCAYAGSGSKGCAVVLTVDPSWKITNGTTFQYDNSNGLYPALAKIDVCNYLCAYTGPNADGWSVILQNRVKP